MPHVSWSLYMPQTFTPSLRPAVSVPFRLMLRHSDAVELAIYAQLSTQVPASE